jgi:hypothetical protein
VRVCHGSDREENRLRLIVVSLPQNGLKSFRTSTAISPLTLQLLLSSQRNLLVLHTKIKSDRNSIRKGNLLFSTSQDWIRPLVTQIHTLMTQGPVELERSTKSFRYYNFLLKSIPKLETLGISGVVEPSHDVEA